MSAERACEMMRKENGNLIKTSVEPLTPHRSWRRYPSFDTYSEVPDLGHDRLRARRRTTGISIDAPSYG